MILRRCSSKFTIKRINRKPKMLLKSGKTVFLKKGLAPFKSLAKKVHNHYDDIFAFWDAPFRITNAYTEGLNGLIKRSNRLGKRLQL
jgi:transposase